MVRLDCATVDFVWFWVCHFSHFLNVDSSFVLITWVKYWREVYLESGHSAEPQYRFHMQKAVRSLSLSILFLFFWWVLLFTVVPFLTAAAYCMLDWEGCWRASQPVNKVYLYTLSVTNDGIVSNYGLCFQWAVKTAISRTPTFLFWSSSELVWLLQGSQLVVLDVFNLCFKNYLHPANLSYFLFLQLSG